MSLNRPRGKGCQSLNTKPRNQAYRKFHPQSTICFSSDSNPGGVVEQGNSQPHGLGALRPTTLLVLLSPGLLFQVPGGHRCIGFGNIRTSGASILVHALSYFGLICIFLIALERGKRRENGRLGAGADGSGAVCAANTGPAVSDSREGKGDRVCHDADEQRCYPGSHCHLLWSHHHLPHCYWRPHLHWLI
ncbi:hypothetical protein Cgig2_018142 [Carnegiea gigantea]|uniref:Uncharacterized protein n=1 Tax=Carnegiea gigantea TaxID=171969 RepID=A0A9Q1KXR9_9CARY|nr:hypothetical protein Cgig2_018142 [Carnegiea gigantea]